MAKEKLFCVGGWLLAKKCYFEQCHGLESFSGELPLLWIGCSMSCVSPRLWVRKALLFLLYQGQVRCPLYLTLQPNFCDASRHHMSLASADPKNLWYLHPFFNILWREGAFGGLFSCGWAIWSAGSRWKEHSVHSFPPFPQRSQAWERIVFNALLKPVSPAIHTNEFAKGKELS